MSTRRYVGQFSRVASFEYAPLAKEILDLSMGRRHGGKGLLIKASIEEAGTRDPSYEFGFDFLDFNMRTGYYEQIKRVAGSIHTGGIELSEREQGGRLLAEILSIWNSLDESQKLEHMPFFISLPDTSPQEYIFGLTHPSQWAP